MSSEFSAAKFSAAKFSAADVQLRMAQVRADLRRSTEGLKHNAERLTDWRYHVRRHPWLAMGVAGMVAFLAVPRRSKPMALDPDTIAQLAEQHRLVINPQEQPKGLGALNSLASAAGSALLRSGLAYLGQYVGHIVGGAAASRMSAQRPQPAERSEWTPGEDGRH